MATSSDWLAEVPHSPEPDYHWLQSIGENQRPFSEGLPFARIRQAPAEPAPEPEVEPEEDPIALAFERGRQEGQAEVLAEANTAAEAAQKFRTLFRALDKEAMDCLASELKETVLALCAQVIDERVIDQHSLIKAAQNAAQKIGRADEGMTLHLHPEDLASIPHDALPDWQFQADSQIARGGFAVRSGEAEVRSGPDEWRRAIRTALGL